MQIKLSKSGFADLGEVWGIRSSAPGEEEVKGGAEAVSQLAAAERRWVKWSFSPNISQTYLKRLLEVRQLLCNQLVSLAQYDALCKTGCHTQGGSSVCDFLAPEAGRVNFGPYSLWNIRIRGRETIGDRVRRSPEALSDEEVRWASGWRSSPLSFF
jgi:hypothetical protein